ncbi:MAG: 4Fe-4S binding protein, partial [Akkermansiaceae bacterium]|nr:4Fe-4S binding protein [Akkermansiaceae bacterium]
EDVAFWRSFHGLALGAPGRPGIDAVSGSTLTSDAIAQAVIDRLGGTAESTLFPTGILLAEVQLLLPGAASLQAHPSWPGVMVVYDTYSKIVAHALRTAPSQDTLLGYQGPSDLLVLLDPAADKVLGLRLRKSFDNDDYVDRLTEDETYLTLYNGLTVREVAEVDFASRGIEGVSGATLTSWAIAESVKRRLAAFVAERDEPPAPPVLALRDYLLIFVTAVSLLMAFTRLRGKAPVRVAWQITVVLVLGFLTGDLLSQALLAGWALHGIPWRESVGLVLLAAAAFIIPWTTGKQLYCHHLCPHGALQQWMQKLPFTNLKVGPRIDRLLSALPVLLLALVLA